LVLHAVVRVRPDLLPDWTNKKPEIQKGLVLQGLFISAGLVIFVSPFASRLPDGLEKTAELLGFRDQAPNWGSFSTPIEKFLGMVALFVSVSVLTRLLKMRVKARTKVQVGC